MASDYDRPTLAVALALLAVTAGFGGLAGSEGGGGDGARQSGGDAAAGGDGGLSSAAPEEARGGGGDALAVGTASALPYVLAYGVPVGVAGVALSRRRG